MTTTKRRAAIAVTVGVWFGALGFAAALTYNLNRPLRWVIPAASQLAAPTHAACAAQVEPVSGAESVLYIPTVTIVGQAPHHPEVALGTKAP